MWEYLVEPQPWVQNMVPLWLCSFSLTITILQPSPHGNQDPMGCEIWRSPAHQFPGIHCTPRPTVADPLVQQPHPGVWPAALPANLDQLLSCEISVFRCYPINWPTLYPGRSDLLPSLSKFIHKVRKCAFFLKTVYEWLPAFISKASHEKCIRIFKIIIYLMLWMILI